MARENEAKLIGYVQNIEKDKENKMVQFTLEVIRRNGRMDYPDVILFPEHYDMAEDVDDGDLVLVKGFFGTMNLKRDHVCANCGGIMEDTSILSNIISIYVQKINGNHTIHDFREVSNSINLLGPLCRPVMLKELRSGIENAQYQMAISRKFRIKNQLSVTTDYPFISSLGEQALEDAKRMEEGSQCWINGGLQTRMITAAAECPHCKTRNLIRKNIMEVVPYNVEYLYNCKFD